MRHKIIILAVGAVILVLAIFMLNKQDRQPYAIFRSPSGLHTLEVYVSKQMVAFPGHGGDAPGIVVLKDNDGNTLEEKKVEMVQLIRDPKWSANNVSVHLVLDWALPSSPAPR